MARSIAIGVGWMELPFRCRRLLALGRSVRGGRDRFHLADRPADQQRADPGVHDRDGGTCRAHATA